MIEIVVHIAGNKEIEPAVAIVVAKCGAGRPITQRDPGFFRDVSERSIVIVVIQAILPKVCDIEIGQPSLS